MPLSPETQAQFEREEQAYWQQRDQLLQRYAGKWVAIVGGQVVAVGESSGAVIKEAFAKTGNKVGFTAQVGREDRILRVRQVATGRHDVSYQPAMPTVQADLCDLAGQNPVRVEFILDTGADLTVLRERVAAASGIVNSPWRSAHIAGVGGSPERRQLYAATVHLAGHGVPVEVDCRDDLDEDILGRDVINEFALTVCAKRDQVAFEWVE